MATLDVIAGGRLTLMVALGWQPEAYAAFGIPWKERVRRFEEAIDILRLLFAQESADYLGRFHRFERVSFHPKPVHGRIPLWIGAGAEPAIRRAARLGDAWIIGPLSALETVKAQMGLYKAALREYAGLTDAAADELVRAVVSAAEREALETVAGGEPVPSSIADARALRLRYICEAARRVLKPREVEVVMRVAPSTRIA